MPALQTIEATAAKVEALEKEIQELRVDFEEARLASETEVAKLETQLRSNTSLTNQIKKDTTDLLELFHTFTTAMKLGVKLTLSLGKIVQWMAGIVIAGGVLYTTYYHIRFGISITETINPTAPIKP